MITLILALSIGGAFDDGNIVREPRIINPDRDPFYNFTAKEWDEINPPQEWEK